MHRFELPEILTGDSVARLAQGAIIGFFLTAAIGFNWAGFGFGWVTGGTAETRAADREKVALVKALAPVCAQKFRAQLDLPVQVAALKGVSSWQRDRYLVEHNFVIPSGEYGIDSAVASACLSLLEDITK